MFNVVTIIVMALIVTGKGVNPLVEPQMAKQDYQTTSKCDMCVGSSDKEFGNV
jgi:hypothetical protein